MQNVDEEKHSTCTDSVPEEKFCTFCENRCDNLLSDSASDNELIFSSKPTLSCFSDEFKNNGSDFLTVQFPHCQDMNV